MTQLCAIPTCRIRGRHLPTCTDPDCAGCLPRVADEGLICDADMARAERLLAEIVRLVPDARSVAYGEVRRGGGGSANKPGSRSPGNDDALDAIQAIGNTLTTLAREIADVRGLTFGAARPLSEPQAGENRSGVVPVGVHDARGSQTRSDSEGRVA